MKSIFRVLAACLGVAVFAVSGPAFSASRAGEPAGSSALKPAMEAGLGAEMPSKPDPESEGGGGSTPADSDPASHDSPASPAPDSSRYLTVFHGNSAERSLRLGAKLRQVGMTGHMSDAAQAVGDAPQPVRVNPEGPLDRSVSPRRGPIQRHAPPRR